VTQLRHVYHYCARKAQNNHETIADGIAYMGDAILGIDDYRCLKQEIAGHGGSTDGWTITSLTYLGKHKIAVNEEED